MDRVFRAANEGDNSARKLVVHGQSISGLADALSHKLDEAIRLNDFTDILSPDREYKMWVILL